MQPEAAGFAVRLYQGAAAEHHPAHHRAHGVCHLGPRRNDKPGAKALCRGRGVGIYRGAHRHQGVLQGKCAGEPARGKAFPFQGPVHEPVGDCFIQAVHIQAFACQGGKGQFPRQPPGKSL